MDQNAKQQAIEQLKNAGSVLVTTNSTPSSDQIAAALGLSQMLKKMGKNVATIVTSSTPANLSFLHTEKQFTNNLDSLRDFIVSLDKNLADKLRYKVEGDEVRIFITPYHTQIGKEDIRFSQGDFNVDAVVVIGANDRSEIDAVVVQNSQVLSSAPVISVTYGTNESSVGTINWHDPQASSVSEMMVSASEALQGNLLDEVISNTLLTGIISATNHFTNSDTSPKVMTMAAQLMAAGADQQKIMAELKTDNGTGTFKAPLHDDQATASTPATPINEQTGSEVTDASDIQISHDEEPKTPEPAVVAPVEAPAVTVQEAPVEVVTPDPIATTVIAEPEAPAPAPQAEAQVTATNSLDDARAAVEAAMNSQPTGTALHPATDVGAQPLTTSSPDIIPEHTPEPAFTPPLPTGDPTKHAPLNPTPGGASPASLYPEPNISEQYIPPPTQ